MARSRAAPLPGLRPPPGASPKGGAPLFPIELRLGPFTLNPHGVLVALGVAVGWLLAGIEVKRKQLDPVFLDRLAGVALLGGLVGARLDYVLFADLPGYLRDPGSVLRVWEGGIALQGGLEGVLVAR